MIRGVCTLTPYSMPTIGTERPKVSLGIQQTGTCFHFEDPGKHCPEKVDHKRTALWQGCRDPYFGSWLALSWHSMVLRRCPCLALVIKPTCSPQATAGGTLVCSSIAFPDLVRRPSPRMARNRTSTTAASARSDSEEALISQSQFGDPVRSRGRPFNTHAQTGQTC